MTLGFVQVGKLYSVVVLSFTDTNQVKMVLWQMHHRSAVGESPKVLADRQPWVDDWLNYHRGF